MKIKKNNSSSLICGFHSVCAALKSRRVEFLFVSESNNNKQLRFVKDLAVKLKIDIQECSTHELSEMVSMKVHQGVVAKVGPLKDISLENFLDSQYDPKPPLIILDRIQDPRNFGSIIRTAAALGAGGIIFSKKNSSQLTPSVAKVASGGLEFLPIISINNIVRGIEKLKSSGYWILAGDPDGEIILGRQELPSPVALVIGGEGTGIRRLVRSSCDFTVRISLQTNKISSLNASVAAGILLNEIVSCRDYLEIDNNKF